MSQFVALRESRLQSLSWVLINRLIVPVGALVLLIAIGRQSDRLLGSYALVAAFYFVMQALALCGLTPFVMREVARQPSQAGAFFVSIGALAILACATVDLVVLLALPWLAYPPDVQRAIGIVALTIFPGILAFLAELILITLHRTRVAGLIAVAENTFRLVASLVALRYGAGVETLFWIVLAGRLPTFLLYLVLTASLPETNLHIGLFDLGILRRTVRVLPPFLLGGVLWVLVGRLDFMVLAAWHPVEQLSHYAIAYRMFDIAMLGSSAIVTGVYPMLARRFTATHARYLSTVRIGARLLVAAVVPVALLGYAVAPEYVLLLFSRQYPASVSLSQAFCLLLVPGIIDQFLSMALNCADRQADDTRAIFAGSMTFVVTLIMLVPGLATTGAFLAMLLATLVQLAVRVAQFSIRFGSPIDRGVLVRWLLLSAGLAALVLLSAGADGAAGKIMPCAIIIILYPGLLMWFRIVPPRLYRGTGKWLIEGGAALWCRIEKPQP